MTGLPPADALGRAAEALGPAERRIAELVARKESAALRRGPAALLKAAGAGPLDLDRLLESAGIDGFDALAAAVREAEDRRLSSPQARFGARMGRATSARELLDRAADRETENLAATLEALRANGALELAAERIVAARRRYVAGGGKSHAYAVLLSADLAAGMSGVTTVDGATVRPLDVLCDVRAGDLLVAFSLRRYTRATLTLAEEFRAAGGEVVGVTDDPDAPLVAHSDVAVVVRTASASYADSPTAVAAVVHIIATLAAARAKGARRRLDRRGALAESLDLYQEN